MEGIVRRIIEKVSGRRIGEGVYFYTDMGRIVSSEEMERYRVSKGSVVGELEGLRLEEHGLVRKPYNVDSLYRIYESNSVLSSVIKQYSMDIAGRELRVEGDDSRELEVAWRLVDNGLQGVIRQAIIDLSVYGYFGIEVVEYHDNRDGSDVVGELRNLRSDLLYRKRDMNMVCEVQLLEGGGYGLKWLWTSRRVGRYGRCWFYSLYNDREKVYGVPRHISAVGEIMTWIGIRDYNLSFFENYGVPSYFVVLRGNWREDSARRLEQYFNSGVIRENGMGQGSIVIRSGYDSTAEIQPLNVSIKEGSFRLYKDSIRDDILMAYSMPPYRIGINVVGKLSGTNIIESNKIYKYGVVEPLQTYIENELVRILGFKECRIKFGDIDIGDEREQAELELQRTKLEIEKLRHGIVTINEARASLGMGSIGDIGDSIMVGNRIINLRGEKI